MAGSREARTALPPSLAANPRLGDWLRVLPGGVVEVRSGKVELGQGVLTALAQVAAEELDVDVARVRMIAAVTGISPDEGPTAGSLSIQHSGAALRAACAEARAIYLGVAAARWDMPVGALTVQDGTIAAPDGRTTSYWELADDQLLDRPAAGLADPKAVPDYRIVGTSVPRVDLPDKLAPRPRFVHDMALDEMLYGRVIRPPSRGAALLDVRTESARALPGVVTVGILAFIGSWNSYILPLFILNDQDSFTLPLGVQAFSSQYSVDTARVLAFTSLSMIPALVFFSIFERRIVGGLQGAVKG